MPWAGTNAVAVDEFEGAIEITDEQYIDAINAMIEGRAVSIENGFEIVDGTPEEPPPDEPTIADYASAAQLVVDKRAKDRGYNDAVTLASYVGSTIPEWAAEAQTFVAWRDSVWVYANTQLALVEAGERPQPTVQEFIEELPAIEWSQPEG
jgi:hypothetical protein